MKRKLFVLIVARRQAASSSDLPQLWDRLSFEDYRDCCNRTTNFIREQPEQKAAKTTVCEWISARRDALLKDRHQVEEREALALVVVNRLINVDLVLIQKDVNGRHFLSVHPNFREV